MTRRVWRFLSATLLAIALTATPGAQERTDSWESIQELGVTFQWDPYRRQGVLVRGTHSLSFSTESPVVMEDYRRIHRISAATNVGDDLVFSDEFLALARRVFPPQTPARRVTAIYIDPGHGGRDPGAIGRHQVNGETQTLQEKDVVLSIGTMLTQILRQRYPEKRIIMSRSEDVYLTLEERTQRANAIETSANEAVVFVSIHANASLNRDASGFEVWYLPTEVRRDNLVSATELGIDDPDLLSILNTLREEEITLESVLLARNVLAGLDARVGSVSPNRGLREESWYVVRNAKMPSILIEVGFVTNPEEFARLQDEAYLLELTQGIYTGVENFVRSFEELVIE